MPEIPQVRPLRELTNIQWLTEFSCRHDPIQTPLTMRDDMGGAGAVNRGISVIDAERITQPLEYLASHL